MEATRRIFELIKQAAVIGFGTLIVPALCKLLFPTVPTALTVAAMHGKADKPAALPHQ